MDIAPDLSRLLIVHVAEAKSAVKHRGLAVNYLIYRLVIRLPASFCDPLRHRLLVLDGERGQQTRR
jgi:hypothetical protein